MNCSVDSEFGQGPEWREEEEEEGIDKANQWCYEWCTISLLQYRWGQVARVGKPKLEANVIHGFLRETPCQLLVQQLLLRLGLPRVGRTGVPETSHVPT